MQYTILHCYYPHEFVSLNMFFLLFVIFTYEYFTKGSVMNGPMIIMLWVFPEFYRRIRWSALNKQKYERETWRHNQASNCQGVVPWGSHALCKTFLGESFRDCFVALLCLLLLRNVDPPVNYIISSNLTTQLLFSNPEEFSST